MKNNLFELGRKYNTDKTHRFPSYGVSYLHVYENIFSVYDRNAELNILEIGVREGPSINMLLEYFPNSTVYGMDINNCTSEPYDKSRFNFIQGDQTNLDDINKIIDMLPVKQGSRSSFDIIIDDGSHLTSDFVFTYNNLFKHLNRNGVYIIEDTYNVYPWYHGCRENGDGSDFNKFALEYIEKINSAHVHKSGEHDPFSIHFYPGVMIFCKQGFK
tara:strand:- start:3425 stop:4069 length:645 start_codon:yes stop_codon:yes gene_type:complete